MISQFIELIRQFFLNFAGFSKFSGQIFLKNELVVFFGQKKLLQTKKAENE